MDATAEYILNHKHSIDDIGRRIVYLLARLHVGKPNAIHRRQLLQHLYPDADLSDLNRSRHDRYMRATIADLIREHGALICSSADAGYYWASTLEEGLASVEQAEGRAMNIIANTHALKLNLRQHFGGQLQLPV